MRSKRLQAIAALVRPGSRLADIGTDHALLPIWLVRQGVCPHAIAADIRSGPAQVATRAVSEACLSAHIEVRIGDGLFVVSADEVDDVVVAGMGAETIVHILKETTWIKDPRYQLVLQPMTRAELLRQYLLTNGFSILCEPIVSENTHLYTVMSVRYTGAPPVLERTAYYRGAVHPVEGRAYLDKQCRILQDRVSGLRTQQADTSEIRELEEMILSLKGNEDENTGYCRPFAY